MTTLKHLIFIAVFVSLSLLAGSALAEDERASEADLERLAAAHQRLETRFSAELQRRADAAIHAEVGRSLAKATTRMLRSHRSVAVEPGKADPAAGPIALAYDTTCTMVGQTLECVLRSSAIH